MHWWLCTNCLMTVREFGRSILLQWMSVDVGFAIQLSIVRRCIRRDKCFGSHDGMATIPNVKLESGSKDNERGCYR